MLTEDDENAQELQLDVEKRNLENTQDASKDEEQASYKNAKTDENCKDLPDSDAISSNLSDNKCEENVDETTESTSKSIML